MKYNNKFNGTRAFTVDCFGRCTHKYSREYMDTIKYYQCKRKGLIQDNGVDYLCQKHFDIMRDNNETEISLSYIEGLGL